MELQAKFTCGRNTVDLQQNTVQGKQIRFSTEGNFFCGFCMRFFTWTSNNVAL